MNLHERKYRRNIVIDDDDLFSSHRRSSRSNYLESRWPIPFKHDDDVVMIDVRNIL